MRLTRIALAASLLLVPVAVRAEDNAPSEWMLLLDARTMSVAPTTYATVSECVMVSTVLNIEASLSTTCLPLHYPKDQVDAYMAERAAAEGAQAAAIKKKREEVSRNRPALEAERRAILDDREKLNQKRYADRVLEIDAMLRLLK